MKNKIEMHAISENFGNALMYMASWTSTIKNTLAYVQTVIEDSGRKYKFIDIGCGKGKVTLISRKLSIVGPDSEAYIGIDFEPTLIGIAKENSTKMFGDEGTFILEDVLKVDYKDFDSSLVLFLYNPFDEIVLMNFLKMVSEFNPILVYVNPEHRATILNFGFKSLTKKVDCHPNLSFEIFELAT